MPKRSDTLWDGIKDKDDTSIVQLPHPKSYDIPCPTSQLATIPVKEERALIRDYASALPPLSKIQKESSRCKLYSDIYIYIYLNTNDLTPLLQLNTTGFKIHNNIFISYHVNGLYLCTKGRRLVPSRVIMFSCLLYYSYSYLLVRLAWIMSW